MAISNEDKKDVSHAFGKKVANKVDRVTHDSHPVFHIVDSLKREYRDKGKKLPNGVSPLRKDAKNKAIHAKMGEGYKKGVTRGDLIKHKRGNLQLRIHHKEGTYYKGKEVT